MSERVVSGARAVGLAAMLLIVSACGKSDAYNQGYSQGHSNFNPLANASVFSVCSDLSDITRASGGLASDSDQSDFLDGCRAGAQASKDGK